jgi:hypothetical protein
MAAINPPPHKGTKRELPVLSADAIKAGQTKEIEDWEDEYDENRRLQMIIDSMFRPGGVYFRVRYTLSPGEDYELGRVVIAPHGEHDKRRHRHRTTMKLSIARVECNSTQTGPTHTRVQFALAFPDDVRVQSSWDGHEYWTLDGVVGAFAWNPSERWFNYAYHRNGNQPVLIPDGCLVIPCGKAWTTTPPEFLLRSDNEQPSDTEKEEDDEPAYCRIRMDLEFDRLWIGPELRKQLLINNWIPVVDVVKLCVSFLPLSMVRHADEIAQSQITKKQKKAH